MFPFILKATIAGLIAASIPLVAKHFNLQLAGIVVLIPATTIMAFIYLWKSLGHRAVGAAAVGGLKGLLPLALFLVATMLLAPRLPMVPALLLAFACWVLGVVILKYVGMVPLVSLLAAFAAWHHLRPKFVYLAEGESQMKITIDARSGQK